MRPTKGTLLPAEADDDDEEEDVLVDPAPALDPVAPAVEPDFPVAEAATLDVVEGPARRRSVEEKVLQFDEAGMRGVYGGVAVKVAGMLQVVVCPLTV